MKSQKIKMGVNILHPKKGSQKGSPVRLVCQRPLSLKKPQKTGKEKDLKESNLMENPVLSNQQEIKLRQYARPQSTGNIITIL